MSTSQLDPGVLAQLSAIAAQFGPFFFALLFIIFVPILGQQYFHNFLEQRTSNDEERKVAIKVYTFYWISGVVTGLILVLISVVWFIYVQSLAPHTVVFERTIRGQVDDDDFAPDPGTRAYTVYYNRMPHTRPPVINVAIVFQPHAIKVPIVDLHYMNRKTYSATQPGGGGVSHAIPFCLKHPEVRLIHDSADSPPRFDRSC